MAKEKARSEEAQSGQNVDDLFREHLHNIIPVNLEDEMRSSFIDYAMSVITDRALPDIRDGLKPVHRRILYTMYTQGFTPDKPYRKCAATVGDVLGRFHPHGDQSVYDALVRLAQDFSMRYLLVDGHGNFGSRDGDAPAAYRYTEARMTRLAMEMMADINKDTVDFQPNFDEHDIEPTVLPAHFPNLLVNGSSGIAVGMATNIPPHNLGEVIDAAIHLMRHPEATVEELMEHIPAPDFPTGGMILGLAGAREAYRTGRGRIRVRANTVIEEMSTNRYQIVVTDLPYMVNKARLIERIADLAKDKRLTGISFVRDESDRNDPVRIVIELRHGANPGVVLNQLYRRTQLEENFSANMLALVPTDAGYLEPRTVTLRDALNEYIKHQKEVVTRRTRFDLDRAEARRHIVEGLLKAIDIIDQVISLIRASATEEEAKQGLQSVFGFSERQAQHIVDMRLGRLTGLEREKLENEFTELTERIAYLNSILDNEGQLIEVIAAELGEIRRRYGDDRRTQIDHDAEDISDESLIPEEDVVITLTNRGYVKRLPLDTYNQQGRGGRGISGVQAREEDFAEQVLVTSSHDLLSFFTDQGRIFRLKAWQIPEGGRHARGVPIVNLLQLDAGETVATVIRILDVEEGGYLFFATEQGRVKKTAMKDFANINRAGLIAIRLRDGDRLVDVRRVYDDEQILLVTRNGQAIRFESRQVRAMGRATYGVTGIRLREDDLVVGVVAVDEMKNLFLVTASGYGKKTSYDDYRIQGRGGYGIITYRVTEKTGPVITARQVEDGQDIILINDSGIVIRIAAADVPVQGRGARGVRVMRTRDAVVIDATVVDLPEGIEEDDDDEDEVIQRSEILPDDEDDEDDDSLSDEELDTLDAAGSDAEVEDDDAEEEDEE